MRRTVELNSLLSKFFFYITWLLYQLIGRDTGRIGNEALTSNPVASLKQWLNDLKITNGTDTFDFIVFQTLVIVLLLCPSILCLCSMYLMSNSVFNNLIR